VSLLCGMTLQNLDGFSLIYAFSFVRKFIRNPQVTSSQWEATSPFLHCSIHVLVC
jgi:hypothetical protein